jgi:hypothetical protein
MERNSELFRVFRRFLRTSSAEVGYTKHLSCVQSHVITILNARMVRFGVDREF